MNEIGKINLTDQAKITLNKITETGNYLNQEINQRKSCSKKLSKCVAAFDYIDKVLIILSATSGEVCIVSYVSVVGAPVGIAGTSFTLNYSVATVIIKTLLSIDEKTW